MFNGKHIYVLYYIYICIYRYGKHSFVYINIFIVESQYATIYHKITDDDYDDGDDYNNSIDR